MQRKNHPQTTGAQPQRGRMLLALAMLIAAGTAAPAPPVLAQATMRSQQNQSVNPAPAGQHQHARHQHFAHPRFAHKGSTFRSSTVVVQTGGVTFITGSGRSWHGTTWRHGWCDGGLGGGTFWLHEPYAVFYGSSGLRQVGPTFDELRTFVPARQTGPGTVVVPEPPREPTIEERLAGAMRDRSYDNAQTLARQHGDTRREAFALLGRGQTNEAAELLARAYREKPELFNEPFRADDWFASRDETRRLLGLAVRNAHREKTAEAWFLVSTIMRAEGRDRLADDMMDRARDAERQQRGVVPREPGPPPTTPATPAPSSTPTTPAADPDAQPPADAPAPPSEEPVVR